MGVGPGICAKVNGETKRMRTMNLNAFIAEKSEDQSGNVSYFLSLTNGSDDVLGYTKEYIFARAYTGEDDYVDEKAFWKIVKGHVGYNHDAVDIPTGDRLPICHIAGFQPGWYE